jgi:hypothetical protein
MSQLLAICIIWSLSLVTADARVDSRSVETVRNKCHRRSITRKRRLSDRGKQSRDRCELNHFDGATVR